MVELKREYVVPLRRKTIVAPKWRRSKKAVSVLKEFIKKHMKTDNVVICSELNEKIWENGIKNPPGKVSIIALKTQIAGEEKTFVNLLDAGLDKHLAIYNKENPQTTSKSSDKKESTKVENKKTVDAQVKEVKKETKKVSEEKVSKKEEKKEDTKK